MKQCTFIFLMLFILLNGCKQNDIANESRVKQVVKKALLSEYTMNTFDYEYDKKKKLLKVTNTWANGMVGDYDEYEHEGSRISKIATYSQSSTGYRNLRSKLFNYYDDGRIKSEVWVMPVINQRERTLYEYDANNRLIKKTNYDIWDKVSNYILIEQDGEGNLIREKWFANDGQSNGEVVYNYENKKLKVIEYLDWKNKQPYRRVTYFYDMIGRVEKIESQELSVSSSNVSYRLLYSYF